MSKKINNSKQYITFEYTFTDKNKTLLGSSQHSGPFTFRVGAGDTLPSIEKHVVGRSVGDHIHFTINAHDAYGQYDTHLNRTISRESMPDSLSFKVGQHITINNQKVIITKITDTEISVDGNHPLAGVDLYFELTITDISDSYPELEHCGCGQGCGCKGNASDAKSNHPDRPIGQSCGCKDPASGGH